jgi:hypothetical protein
LVASLTNFSPRQFLERIVTADENWVYNYEPESKAQSMVWKLPTSLMARKSKIQPSAGKNMLKISGIWKVRFWFISLQTVKVLTVRNIMKRARRGRRFSSDEEVNDAVQNWLNMQQKNFFSDGIKNLVKRWKRCVEVEGDYVEK